MCGYCYIGFVGFMLKGNNLTNLFQKTNLKNDDIILNYFKNRY